MEIKIKLDFIPKEKIKEICDLYNTKKEAEWPSIIGLDRMEGGFAVLSHSELQSDNQNRQLRWNKKILKQSSTFPMLLNEEIACLGSCMKLVLKENVTFNSI
jgi:hypothetical protein